ncbi:condensation domain-containing protein [Kitasatospora sp. NPDC005856]|uniref:condensation domain-containing protein n=1 Tax=Kitasatospora sp. NPDC005856 TaxID=3154566 RepID=UPI003405993E
MNARDTEDIHGLSPMQEGLLFHTLQNPDRAMYVQQLAHSYLGTLDVAALRAAWQTVVDRHSVLRSSFAWERLDKPLQLVHRQVPVEFTELDWTGLDEAGRAEREQRLLQEDRERGFDLAAPPLMRFYLARLGEDRHRFVVSVHHLILDGWSTGVVLREVAAAYTALSAGRTVELPEPRPFRAYVDWLRGKDPDRAETHWRRELKGVTGPTPLLADARPGAGGGEQHVRALELSEADAAAVLAAARERRLTLGTFVQGAWALLLARYAGTAEAVFGTVSAGRPAELEGSEEMVGLFVNTLPTRVPVDPAARVGEWLTDLQEAVVATREHEHVPLTHIQEWSDVPAGTELFETVQVVQNALDPSVLFERFADLEVADPVYFTRTSFPLTLAVVPGDRPLLRVMYDSEWLSDAMAERLLGHLAALLAELAGDPERTLGRLPMLTPGELAELTGDGTAAEQPVSPVEVAAEHARSRPEAIAVSSATRTLTRAELESAANRLARHLAGRGAGSGAVVAVLLADPVDALTAQLAAWKIGAVAAPLDAALDAPALCALLQDLRPAVLLAAPGAEAPSGDHRVVRLDAEALAGCSDAPLDHAPRGTDLAQAAVSAGTEDVPKAALLDHAVLGAAAAALAGALGLGEDDAVLRHAPADSYLALVEVLAALATGARLAVPAARACGDAAVTAGSVADAVRETGATCAVLTPAVLGALDPQAAPRTLVVTGERLPTGRAAAWAGTGRTVVSLYGSVETAGAAAAGRTTAAGSEPVRPLAGRRAYVLGPEGIPLPAGVAGELYLAGPSLSRGYLNRPSLTVQSYQSDPFAPAGPERMFRTGDLARRTEDGGLELLGRVSERITVAGRSAHPARVADLLGAHPGVAAGAVAARDGQEGPGLTGYLVPAESGPEGADRHDQVGQWRQIYEHTYADRADTGDVEFNIVGWNSTFTGGAIPEEEMREWQQATLAQLRAQPGERILEIGCGTGMLLLPLSRERAQYWGTDLSPAALDYVREQLAAPAYANADVTLLEREAQDFTGIPEGHFDLVVINSVIQYFPDDAYLRRVLDNAVRALRPGGRIFAGDIRNLATLDAMHLSVQFANSPEDRPARDTWLAGRARARQEEELVLDPQWFHRFAAEAAPGAVARIAAKRGRARNELTCYRYDVLVDLADGQAVPAGTVRAWREGGPQVAELLAGGADSVLLTEVPDARVAEAVEALARLARGGAPATTGRLIEAVAVPGADPEDLYRAAEAAGYRADVLVGATPGTVDALFTRVGSPAEGAAARSALWRGARPTVPAAHERLANDPLVQRRDSRLLTELQSSAERELPAAAVPHDYLVLPGLPTTRDGRTDHALLRALRGSGRARRRDLVAPRDTTELLVAQVWEDVLGARPIGATDNFFELGGHSLVAMRVVSRLQRQFNRDLTLADLLNHPTVEELAAVLREGAGGPGRSPVVTLQPEGEQPPYFLVHPSGGNLLVYQFLAERLAPEVPVYMLETPELDRFASVEELAAHYADAVRATVPSGPYRLGGLSFGGLVAFETARQLAEAGERVELVTMFESSLAGTVPADISEEDLLAYRTVHFTHVFELIFGRRIPLTEEELRGLDAEQQLKVLYQRIDESFPGDLATGLLHRTVRDVQIVRGLIRHYRPRATEVPVSLFIGLEPMPPHLNDPEFYRGDRALGWDAHLSRLRLVDTPGNHLSLLNPPHVETLAGHVRDLMRETSATPKEA